MHTAHLPVRRVIIDSAQLAPYECWALLFIYLAYPEPSTSERTLQEVFSALCHVHLSMRERTDEAWAIQPQFIKPVYAFLDPRVVNRALRTFDRRLRDRMVAARMAIAFLKEISASVAFKRPKSVKRLSLNKLSEFVVSDLKDVEPGNIEQRIWRTSLPVIHLAVALALLIDAAERDAKPRFLIEVAPACVPGLIVTAQQINPMLLSSPRLRLRPEQLIALEYS